MYLHAVFSPVSHGWLKKGLGAYDQIGDCTCSSCPGKLRGLHSFWMGSTAVHKLTNFFRRWCFKFTDAPCRRALGWCPRCRRWAAWANARSHEGRDWTSACGMYVLSRFLIYLTFDPGYKSRDLHPIPLSNSRPLARSHVIRHSRRVDLTRWLLA